MDVENKFVFVGFTAKGIMPQIAVPNNKPVRATQNTSSVSRIYINTR